MTTPVQKKLARVIGEFKGEYDPSGLYKILDEVRVSGDGVYRALKDVPLGTAPNDLEFWIKTVSDTKAVPAISSKGISKLGGNLSYSNGTLTIPRFRALYTNTDGTLEIKTFLKSTFNINPSVMTNIVVDSMGTIKVQDGVNPTDTLVILTSWERTPQEVRPLANQITVDDFLPAKPLDYDSEYGVVVKLSDFGASTKDPSTVAPAFGRVNKFMPDGFTLFIDGDYASNSTCLITDKSAITVMGGRLFKNIFGWSDEYILRFERCNMPRIVALSLKGLNGESTQPSWGEQGCYFRACTGPAVDSCFFESFGDAGLRYHSGGYDSATVPDVVQAFDVRVTNSYFNYCYQNTMTPGGNARVIWTGNTFLNSGGTAVKVASRVTGAYGTIINGNIVENCKGIAFEMQGGKKVHISNNIVLNTAQFISLMPNSDGVSNQYPRIVPFEEVMVLNNLILDATGRFMYMQNSHFFLNNTDIFPPAGSLIIRGNYFKMKNTGTLEVPQYGAAEAIRLFCRTLTGENGLKHQNTIAKYLDICDNIFDSGFNWVTASFAVHSKSVINIERNKILNYDGDFMQLENMTSPYYYTDGTALHINDNFSNSCRSGVSLSGSIGSMQIEDLFFRNNQFYNLMGTGLSTFATNKGFSKNCFIENNTFKVKNGFSSDSALCYLSVGDSVDNLSGELLFTKNSMWFSDVSTGRPVYIDRTAKIGNHFCHSNFSKGGSGISRSDSDDITVTQLGLTVL